MTENEIGTLVIAAAIAVHRELGHKGAHVLDAMRPGM